MSSDGVGGTDEIRRAEGGKGTRKKKRRTRDGRGPSIRGIRGSDETASSKVVAQLTFSCDAFVSFVHTLCYSWMRFRRAKARVLRRDHGGQLRGPHVRFEKA